MIYLEEKELLYIIRLMDEEHDRCSPTVKELNIYRKVFSALDQIRNEIRSNIKCEYGSLNPVQFATSENTKLCISEGEEAKCLCGNPATELIAGLTSYVTRCNNCMGY